ncbi:MAG: hypothetical protein IJA12_00160 [Oscillospiraceae bacterium]|nr:hypothetical protein [Oscillospiraceae bacterium]
MKKTKLVSILTALTMITSYSAIATAYSLGDANSDGYVNVRDCAHIAKFLAKRNGSSLPETADYNSDGTVDVRDAAKLASDIAKGNITSNSEFEYKGKLATGGDVMTIMCHTGADLDPMLEAWMENEGYTEDQVQFLNFQVGGGEAATLYEQTILGDYKPTSIGENVQIDMFLVEPDWAHIFLNNDNFTAPIYDLGFTEADFKNQYSFSNELDTDSNGVLKSVSWKISPGGWCYRTDLAEKYLGVKSPEEMQELVSDWDKFESTAKKIYEASNGKTTITATNYGMENAYIGSRSEPLIENGRFTAEKFIKDFMNLSKRMNSNGYINPNINAWSSDWYDLGQTDSNMGYFVPDWGFGSSILETAAGGENGATYGKWGACQGPSPYYWGGSAICVTPFTDNADMVASFINYFAVNTDTIKSFALDNSYSNKYFMNNQTAMQKIIDEGHNKNPLLNGQDEYAVLHENAKALDLENCITPYDSDISIALADAVGDYTKGEVSTIEECYEIFNNRLSELLPEITVE